jgi:transcriptional regulator with XRE-family HTH domain
MLDASVNPLISIRKKLNISQHKLGDVVGYGQSWCSLVETNRRRISSRDVYKIISFAARHNLKLKLEDFSAILR